MVRLCNTLVSVPSSVALALQDELPLLHHLLLKGAWV
jgi:hypothetical protein